MLKINRGPFSLFKGVTCSEIYNNMIIKFSLTKKMTQMVLHNCHKSFQSFYLKGNGVFFNYVFAHLFYVFYATLLQLAHNIFEAGLKRFMHEPSYILE